MKNYVFFCLSLLLLAGCGKQIQSFVGSTPTDGTTPPIAAILSKGTGAIKVSPGAAYVTGTGAVVDAQVNITMKNRPLTGTVVDARVSFNQVRAEAQ